MSSSMPNNEGQSQQQQQRQQQSSTSTTGLISQRPRSLCSGSLPDFASTTSSSSAVPSLLSSALPAQRPRRLWTVNDTALRPIPRFYPKLDPKCTVYISDASPSVIAVRISECLRKRSIAVEYDEEAVTATAMTVDRCHFVIKMYRGNTNKRLQYGAGVVDFSHGVVVECMRITGSVLSFHRACRAVLQSAMGQSAGNDTRKPYTTGVLEFRRLKKPRLQRQRQVIQEQDQIIQAPSASSGEVYYDQKDMQVDDQDDQQEEQDSLLASTCGNTARSTTSAGHALEQARELIHKDRLECQQLGMERLVGLTNVETCGKDISLYVSLQILQEENWILNLLKETQPRTSEAGDPSDTTAATNNTCNNNRCTSLLRFDQQQQNVNNQDEAKPFNDDDSDSNKSKPESSIPVVTAGWSEQESRHEGIMRASALRVFCNALSVVSDAGMLQKIVDKTNCPLVEKSLLDALVQDLMGANRPPSVVLAAAGGHTRLSSIHEAALAMRCLRLLSEVSKSCQEYLQSDQIMERLEMARTCGRSTHLFLQQEAELTYSQLTEDLRSC